MVAEDIQRELKMTVRIAAANECIQSRKVSFQSSREKMADFSSSMRGELLILQTCQQ